MVAAAISGDPHLSATDVLLIQEIEDHPGEGGSRASRLAAALKMAFVYAPARTEGDGTHGLAILSRYPLERVEVMELPDFEFPIRALSAGLRIETVVIECRPRRAGQSKSTQWHRIVGVARDLFELRARRFRGE